MVKSFNLARIPQIYLGRGRYRSIVPLIKHYGDRIALLTGRRSFIESKAGADILSMLETERIHYDHFVIPCEPSPAIVDEITDLLRADNTDVVLSIGGGSVIDAGKAVSAMIKTEGSVKEYLEGVGNKEHSGNKVPFIAVPTTSGTGSEATKNAVISESGTNGFKKSLRHDNFVPEAAVIDPELTIGCPPDITAASGLDCFTQLTEAYLSDKSTDLTDALATEGFRAIKNSLLQCCRDGDNIEARQGMAYAALMSGICLANAGLGAVHGLAGTIGGMFDIPHGVVCGLLMAPANVINVRELRKNSPNHAALKKYALLGQIFIDEKERSDDYYIDSFIDYLIELSGELRLPGLNKYGINDSHISAICEITDIKNNPVRLSRDALAGIVSSRI